MLTGVSTGSGVESTARSASDHGHPVGPATGAMSDPDAGAHRHSVERVFPKLGRTATACPHTWPGPRRRPAPRNSCWWTRTSTFPRPGRPCTASR
ncbi:hypothetical protein ACF09H_11930 [Streptomyces sp. NPDC014983]|uniref:hypothetical protein n=1 Tax=Streptomyces sp. NPDC014983 TaxID=3364933 RepID=UPI0036FC7E79